MEKTMIEEIIKGVGVIIDDDYDAPDSSVFRLVKSIEDEGRIPLVKYDSIPDVGVIESMGNISFIILDWRFDKESGIDTDDVFLGSELKSDTSKDILEFLSVLLDKCFVPVFLITGQNFDEIKNTLVNNSLYSDDGPNRIMLKEKDGIENYSQLIENVENWLSSTPSAFALKLWEKEAVLSKNRMFLDLYQASPDWVHVILKCLEEDTKDNPKTINNEFNALLNNNFVNRMKDGDYMSISRDKKRMLDKDAIRRVLEGERFIKYDDGNNPDISYLGDLYKEEDDDKYWVNIRAQCDLVRIDDPVLYLIGGTVIEIDSVTKPNSVKLSGDNDDNILQLNGEKYKCKELSAFDKKQRGEFNSSFQESNTTFVYNKGEILEKKTYSIIPCIAGKTLLKFCFKDFKTVKRSEEENESYRIGRIIPPYITRIQKNFTSYMIREGLMSVPEDLLF